MSLVLTKILDPRDNLDKATRDEVWDFAKANGIDFDQRTTPKPIMVQVLRNKGLVDIRVPTRRVMGRAIYDEEPEAPRQETATVDVNEHIMAEWKKQQAQPNDRPSLVSQSDTNPVADVLGYSDKAIIEDMTVGQLRKELKTRGIKFDRKDRMDVLREKLSVQNPT